MKNIIVSISATLLISLFANAQSILLTPGKAETKYNGSNHLVLRGTSSPSIIGVRQSGTLSSPTNTTVDDEMLNFEAQGWVNGNSTTSQGMLRFVSTQNWTNANRGNKLDIWTTKNGENTPYRRFTIDHNGKV